MSRTSTPQPAPQFLTLALCLTGACAVEPANSQVDRFEQVCVSKAAGQTKVEVRVEFQKPVYGRCFRTEATSCTATYNPEFNSVSISGELDWREGALPHCKPFDQDNPAATCSVSVPAGEVYFHAGDFDDMLNVDSESMSACLFGGYYGTSGYYSSSGS